MEYPAKENQKLKKMMKIINKLSIKYFIFIFFKLYINFFNIKL